MMFLVTNNFLKLLAWSSMANMGLLFLLLSQATVPNYAQYFMLYYGIGVMFVFLMAQFLLLNDQTAICKTTLAVTDLTFLNFHKTYLLV